MCQSGEPECRATTGTAVVQGEGKAAGRGVGRNRWGAEWTDRSDSGGP